MKKILSFTLLSLALSSCSSNKPFNLSAPDSKFLSTGSIVISRQVTNSMVASNQVNSPVNEPSYTPVLGYIPPMSGILPASNETWLELDSKGKTMTLVRGEERVKTVDLQGNLPLAPGKYALQYKQKFPTWYAPNSYFEKRNLQVPGEQDQSRYLKGALGEYALYPTSTVVIHSSPIWSEEIGGLRAKKQDIADVFSQLSLGSSIIVK